MRALLACLAAALALPVAAVAQSAAPVIDITPADGGISVSGVVLGLADAQVHAAMRIHKSGPFGTIDTRQARDIALTPASRDVVATTTLQADHDTLIEIELTITQDGTTVASARSVLGQGE